ncbi:MAG TPA: hypothetical protein VF092_19275 [Longimicrobium sp.]
MLSACSDGGAGGGGLLPTGPDYLDSFQLETLEVTSCQYGGTYPNCQSAPSSGGTTTAQPNGGAPGGGSGGTTGSTTGSEPTPTCDPSTDPKCELPLTKTDSATIQKSLHDYLRPESEIADTTARRRCGEMRRQFETSFANGTVFRGASDSQDSTAHYGMTYVSRIHMDPWLLNGAASGNTAFLRDVANTALHEAAHVLGFSHPNGFTLDSAGHDLYTDPYFNLLSPGPNSCIKY